MTRLCRGTGLFLLRTLVLLTPILLASSTGTMTAGGTSAAYSPKVTVEPVAGGMLITINFAPSTFPDQSSGGGWEQRFEKVSGQLELRVDKHDGPLIRWPDRGNNSATWTSSNPQPETRSIAKWVGNGYQITLWARISPDGGKSKPLCYMDTIYNGNLQQRWEIYGDKGYSIRR
jgi:hypothetical protein